MAGAMEALNSLLRKLGEVALNKALELYHVSDQVEPMQQELLLIQAYLRDADSKRKTRSLEKEWLNQIRDVAHQIEDMLDTFLVEIEKNKSKGSEAGFFSKWKRVGKNPLKLESLSSDMKDVTRTLKMLYARKQDLGITNVGDRNTEEDAKVPFRPTKLSDVDVSEIVGLESQTNQIVSHLLDRNIKRRTVISIVGTGGLGKTTLAQKVYKSRAELEKHFDCRIWLSISQNYNLSSLLRKILYSTEPRRQRKQGSVEDEDLPGEVEKSLSRKRYLIFLDDVWTDELWERLKNSLPDNDKGSRVIITTRSIGVAKAADRDTKPLKLSRLNEHESLVLLFRKAFQQRGPKVLDSQSEKSILSMNRFKYLIQYLATFTRYLNPLIKWLYHQSDEDQILVRRISDPAYSLEYYPQDLIAVGKKLTKKCGRLPLALVVLGGILSKKDPTYTAWNMLEQTMNWHDEEGSKCSRVLAMSYEQLPTDLKQCFRYFASFPQGSKISARHVIRMWIAEEFISKDGDGTLEDKAELCFEELVQRCMVEVVEQSWNGHCKYCRVHDVLRELIINEAKKEKFFSVFSKAEDYDQPAASVGRRIALQYTGYREYNIRPSRTRSVFCFGQTVSNNNGFKLLKLLSIEGIDMSYMDFNYKGLLESLIHLRYLGFRHCEKVGPAVGNVSFGSLAKLETLDFKGTIVQKLHESVWLVPTLRHVVCPLALPGPLKWDHLENLQTLQWVNSFRIPKEGGNIKLRKIGLHLDKHTKFWEQCGSVEQVWHTWKKMLTLMRHLDSLAIRSIDEIPFGVGGTKGLPCHETIQRLYLHGAWPRNIVLNINMLPTKLTKLTLTNSKLYKDPMPELERLKNLSILRLRKSYFGDELACSTGGFPCLQTLELSDLPNVRTWDIQAGAMANLTRLKIVNLAFLSSLPELQKVPTLQHLQVLNCPRALHRRAQAEDKHKIKHIVSLRI